MDIAGIVKNLKSLCQLDIDAMHAYMQVKDHIEQNDIKNIILKFQSDHARHVQDLSEMIRSFGETPPEFSRDFKGFLLQAFTSVRSITGTEGALKALNSGEKMVNKQYKDALSLDVPLEVMTLVKRNYEDEKRHLDYIERAISGRIWEKAAA